MSVLGFATGVDANLLPLLARQSPGAPPTLPVATLGELASVLRSSLPNGPMASLPRHVKEVLAAQGVGSPTGADALSQQRTLAQIEQRMKSAGEDAQLANVDLQNALQKQQQMMQTLSNVSKAMHETARSVISNIR